MSEIKKFEEITQPDERQKDFEIIDPKTKQCRKLSINDIYGVSSSIVLHDGVPEEIRNHFSTAKNLLVYSWFYYPFNVTAEFMAYVSLEFALRFRFNDKKDQKFKELIRMAIDKGLLNDEGFSHIQEQYDSIRILEPEKGIVPEKLNNYAEILFDTLPYLRNELAHGSSLLHNHGVFSVRICAEFINQLFQNSSR